MQLNYASPLHYASPRARSRDRLPRFPMWAVLVAGYIAFSRGFAYIGIAPLFIGEAYLGYAILKNSRNWTGRFVNGFLRMRILPLAIGVPPSVGYF